MKFRHKSGQEDKNELPMTPMIDIVFLLIIFFLICSEVAKDKANLQVTLPNSEHVQKVKATVAARIAIDAEGDIFFDGTRVDSAKDVEWGVRAMLANTVADDQRHIQFKCDAALPKETFEPVLKAIAEAGGIIEAVGENNQ